MLSVGQGSCGGVCFSQDLGQALSVCALLPPEGRLVARRQVVALAASEQRCSMHCIVVSIVCARVHMDCPCALLVREAMCFRMLPPRGQLGVCLCRVYCLIVCCVPLPSGWLHMRVVCAQGTPQHLLPPSQPCVLLLCAPNGCSVCSRTAGAFAAELFAGWLLARCLPGVCVCAQLFRCVCCVWYACRAEQCVRVCGGKGRAGGRCLWELYMTKALKHRFSLPLVQVCCICGATQALDSSQTKT